MAKHDGALHYKHDISSLAPWACGMLYFSPETVALCSLMEKIKSTVIIVMIVYIIFSNYILKETCYISDSMSCQPQVRCFVFYGSSFCETSENRLHLLLDNEFCLWNVRSIWIVVRFYFFHRMARQSTGAKPFLRMQHLSLSEIFSGMTSFDLNGIRCLHMSIYWKNALIQGWWLSIGLRRFVSVCLRVLEQSCPSFCLLSWWIFI